MWFVFNILGADGHFFPLVPLARELEEAGHEVTFVTGPGYCERVERRGFTVVAVDERGVASADAGERRTAMRGLRGDERVRFAYRNILDRSVAHARGLVDLCRGRHPDVIIRETTALGGWLAAEVLDVPGASFEFSPTRPARRAAVMGDLLQAARAEMGLAPDETLASLDRWLTILGGPPGWFPPEVFGPTTHLFQPPEDPPTDGALPDWFAAMPDRPTVYVTLGGALNQTPGVFEMVFEAVADLNANVIATVGRTVDPAGFSPQPDHVHVEQFIPQSLLLPECDALIAHGGYGSLMGALRHGLPVVAIPLAVPDNPINAARVEKLGVGIAIKEDSRSATSILQAARAVLEEPAYGATARDLAAKMAELPPFTHSARLLEQLARHRQPILAS